ncbi:MAG: hypothetical protein SVY15_04065 [Halobacteriota archaeon]|nr:hypothetical protein [Halobacteriota archaeon]
MKLRLLLILMMLISLISVISVEAEEELLIDSYNYLNNDSSFTILNTGDFVGQAITLNDTAYITKISMLCGKQFGIFNYSGAIYETNGGVVGVNATGSGIAIVYSSNNITQDEIPTVPTLELLNFTFNPAVELTAGDYVIGVEKTSGTFSISVAVGDITAPTHYGNGAWKTPGWTADEYTDLVFYLFGYYEDYEEQSTIKNLTYESGETWISWNWESDSSIDTIVDGKYYNDAGLGTFTLTNLNPNERHQIILIHNDTEFYQSTAYTKQISIENNLMYLLLFAILFMVLGQKFTGFGLVSIILFFVGGVTSLLQSSEPWIIISYWLCLVFSVFSIRFGGN